MQLPQKKFKNALLNDLFWIAAIEHQIRKFNKEMENIGKIDSNARRWLESVPLSQWSFVRDGGHHWGIVTTNYVERFNSVLKGARVLPIIACVQLIFYRIVKHFDNGRLDVQKYLKGWHVFMKHVGDEIDKEQKKANTHGLQAYDRYYLFTITATMCTCI